MPDELVFDIAECVGASAPDLIDRVEDSCRDVQATLSTRFLYGLQCGLGRIEHHTMPAALNLTEQPMFDGIPLGRIGRIVGNAQAHTQVVGQVDQIFFEAQRARGIGATAVTQQHQLGGIGVPVSEDDLPSQSDGIADESAVFAGGAEGDETDVGADIVDAVGHQHTVG